MEAAEKIHVGRMLLKHMRGTDTLTATDVLSRCEQARDEDSFTDAGVRLYAARYEDPITIYARRDRAPFKIEFCDAGALVSHVIPRDSTQSDVFSAQLLHSATGLSQDVLILDGWETTSCRMRLDPYSVRYQMLKGPSDSPFETIESIRCSEVKNLVAAIGNSFNTRDDPRVKSRLTQLCEAWIDEHPGGEAPSPDALLALLTFLSSQPAPKLPEITMAPDGTWLAEWRPNDKNAFVAHFTDATTARFVVLAERVKAPRGKQNQACGEIDVAAIPKTLEALRATSWVFA